MRALVGILLFFLAAGMAAAKTDLRFASGSCDGSSWQWWSVQRFENGRLVETWGVDCNGKEYHIDVDAASVPGNSPFGIPQLMRSRSIEYEQVPMRVEFASPPNDEKKNDADIH